jgi:ABC-type sulfate/molybdate transport systems ATPase subunit
MHQLSGGQRQRVALAGLAQRSWPSLTTKMRHFR